jgi:hypothetical protein
MPTSVLPYPDAPWILAPHPQKCDLLCTRCGQRIQPLKPGVAEYLAHVRNLRTAFFIIHKTCIRKEVEPP